MPLAFVAVPSVFEERRCKRFNGVEPFASARSAFEEHRCKRFLVVKPFASRLSALRQTLSAFKEHRR